jgi:hypothetical protein
VEGKDETNSGGTGASGISTESVGGNVLKISPKRVDLFGVLIRIL